MTRTTTLRVCLKRKMTLRMFIRCRLSSCPSTFYFFLCFMFRRIFFRFNNLAYLLLSQVPTSNRIGMALEPRNSSFCKEHMNRDIVVVSVLFNYLQMIRMSANKETYHHNRGERRNIGVKPNKVIGYRLLLYLVITWLSQNFEAFRSSGLKLAIQCMDADSVNISQGGPRILVVDSYDSFTNK